MIDKLYITEGELPVISSNPFATCIIKQHNGNPHRLMLGRQWDAKKPMAAIIGLNPSTANDTTDDPTIRKLIALCQGNGYGGFYMLNLFTLVSPHPSELLKHDNLHPEADQFILELMKKSDDIIVMWGSLVKKLGKTGETRINQIWQLTGRKPISCFGMNADYNPVHPLYKKNDTKLEAYLPF